MPWSGLGSWIWYLDQAEGGDLEAITAKALSHGVTWIAIKTSDGDQLWRAQADRIRDLKADGLRVCSWSYNHGKNIKREAAAAVYALLQGSDGHIFDIEAEFARWPDAANRAQRLVAEVRESFLTLPLAYAPLPVIDNFPGLPYEAFHELGLPAMPQWYTKVLGDGTNYPLNRLIDIWNRWQGHWQHPAPAIYPVLQAYGSQTADNLREEIALCQTSYPGLSLFRWGAMHEMWEVLSV